MYTGINFCYLCGHQSGIRKNHSTETLNIAVKEAMDNKQLSIVVFLDMCKAFDSVCHDMLLQRILNLGVGQGAYVVPWDFREKSKPPI